MKEEDREIVLYLCEELTGSLDLIADAIKELALAQSRTAEAIFTLGRDDGPVDIIGFQIAKGLEKASENIATSISCVDHFDVNLVEKLKDSFEDLAANLKEQK